MRLESFNEKDEKTSKDTLTPEQYDETLKHLTDHIDHLLKSNVGKKVIDGLVDYIKTNK